MQERRLRKRSSRSTAVEEDVSKSSNSIRELYDPLLSDIPLNKPTTIHYRGRKAGDSPPSPENQQQRRLDLEPLHCNNNQKTSEGILAEDDNPVDGANHDTKCRSSQQIVQSNALVDPIVEYNSNNGHSWPHHQPYSLSVHEESIVPGSNVDSTYICTICGCLDANCLRSPCTYRHIFCHDCLFSWAKICPLCQQVISLELCTPPPDSIRNSILSVKVICTSCPEENRWIGALGLIPIHWRSSCLGRKIRCDLYAVGCSHTCISPLMPQHMYEAQNSHMRLLRARIETEENEREQLYHQLRQARLNFSVVRSMSIPHDATSPVSTTNENNNHNALSSLKIGVHSESVKKIESGPHRTFIDPTVLMNGLCNWDLTQAHFPVLRYSKYNMGSSVVSTDPGEHSGFYEIARQHNRSDVMKAAVTGFTSHYIEGRNMFIICSAQIVHTLTSPASSHTYTYGCLPSNKKKRRAGFQLRYGCINLWHLVSLSGDFCPTTIAEKLLIPLRDLPIEYTNPKAAVAATKETVTVLVAGENSQNVSRLLLKRNKTGHLDTTVSICWEQIVLTDVFEVKEVGVKSISCQDGRVYASLNEVLLRDDSCNPCDVETLPWGKDFACLSTRWGKWNYSDKKLHYLLEVLVKINIKRLEKNPSAAVQFLLGFFEPDRHSWVNATQQVRQKATGVNTDDLVVVIELLNWDKAVCLPKQVVGDSIKNEIFIDTCAIKDKLYCISIEAISSITHPFTKRHAKLAFYQHFCLRQINKFEGSSLSSECDIDPDKKAEILWLYHRSLYLDTGEVCCWNETTRSAIIKVFKEAAQSITASSNCLSLISSILLSSHELNVPSLERLFVCLIGRL